MNKKLFLILFLLPCFLQAQIAAGPMLGYTELRTARVWVQYESSQDLKEVKYEIEPHYLFVSNEKSLPEPEIETEILDYKHKIVMIHFNNLQPGVTYHYAISTFKNKVVKKITTVKKKKIEHSSIVREPVKVTGNFQTQELWQFRKQAPDFGFITGSCNYVNQTVYDRPGKPYGGDSIIFNSMTKELEANFMLWLGDNWYAREADYFSAWGLFTRAEYDRNKKIMQPLFKRMPQYAIWDDHDYGFNDGDKSYFLKKESRDVFKTFWANPTYGENNEGIY
ncbi:MAG: hypothetical protein QM539_09890, partial [Alphaproteobacteria bacterium]|nr:hypothetical protein [Alphaproteobacteria bacterium]